MTTTPLEELVLGGIAAGCSKTLSAPIERVKLLLQNQNENVRRGITLHSQRYTGMIDAFTRLPREQGFASFWRGNLANVVRYIPQMALNFAFKDAFKSLFPESSATSGASGSGKGSSSFGTRLCRNMAFGGAAGASSLVVVYPLDFARTRMAMDLGVGGRREFTGILQCVLKTAQKGGWGTGGVYNGFGVSCAALTVGRGLQFGIYDTLRDTAAFANASTWQKFGLGYAVTAAAGTAVYPLDTVRRRLMMTSGGGSQVAYSGALDCARTMLEAEGWRAFYRGVGSNVLRSLCGALVLVLFDDLKAGYVGWKRQRGGSHVGDEDCGDGQRHVYAQ